LGAGQGMRLVNLHVEHAEGGKEYNIICIVLMFCDGLAQFERVQPLEAGQGMRLVSLNVEHAERGEEYDTIHSKFSYFMTARPKVNTRNLWERGRVWVRGMRLVNLHVEHAESEKEYGTIYSNVACFVTARPNVNECNLRKRDRACG